jgi:hypothetical protein
MAPGPDPGTARCPVCGWLDAAAAVEDLFVVTGASGAGKTTVLAPLARLLAGRCACFDVDWLIDPAAAQARGRPIDWPALRDAWLAVAHGVAQGGLPTVLLGPLLPEHLGPLPARPWVGEIRYLLLDCSDEVRRERIERRPPWRGRQIDEQIRFGRSLRATIGQQVDTTHARPAETAAAVAAWVGGYLD